jgi:hypothetical protein
MGHVSCGREEERGREAWILDSGSLSLEKSRFPLGDGESEAEEETEQRRKEPGNN